MNPKALLIPIAAFALSATSVSAYNPDVLERAGLTNKQIQAFQMARELQQEGDKNKARSILQKAGISVQVMESVREAMYDHKNAMRTAIADAVAHLNYEEFKDAIKGSPVADIVTSEAEFKMFAQAHTLKEQGKATDAKSILAELGGNSHLLQNTMSKESSSLTFSPNT